MELIPGGLLTSCYYQQSSAPWYWWIERVIASDNHRKYRKTTWIPLILPHENPPGEERLASQWSLLVGSHKWRNLLRCPLHRSWGRSLSRTGDLWRRVAKEGVWQAEKTFLSAMTQKGWSFGRQFDQESSLFRDYIETILWDLWGHLKGWQLDVACTWCRVCEFKIHTPHWIDSAHGAHVRSNIQTMYCSMISSMYAVWLYHYSSSKNQNYAQDGHHSNLISFL